MGEAGKIKATCLSFNRPIRIVNAPAKKLDCYVEVRQFKDDLIDLLNDLADEVWADFVIVKDIA